MTLYITNAGPQLPFKFRSDILSQCEKTQRVTMDGIEEIPARAAPFDPDAKIFWIHRCQNNDDVDENYTLDLCEKHGCFKGSYNEFMDHVKSTSGINTELLGPKNG